MIRVFGQEELVSFLENGGVPAANLISISNPPDKLHPHYANIPPIFMTSYVNILRLQFHDIFKFKWNRTPPQEKHADQALAFLVKYGFDIDIHCWAGVSRSTAVAFALLYMMCDSEKEAAKALCEVRNVAAPNPLLVKHFDRILKTDLSGQLQEIVDANMERIRAYLDKDLEEL